MPAKPLIFEKLSDEELVSLANSGNAAAENELVNRMSSTVYYAAKGLHFQGIENADLMQEGMIGLIYAIRTFNPQNSTKFKTYAKTCIANQLSSTIRRLKQKKQIPEDRLISIEKHMIQDTGADPQELYIAREKVLGLVEDLRAQSSALEFKVFQKYLSGYSAAEIAEQLGISVKRVSNALYRIRQKFHSLIK